MNKLYLLELAAHNNLSTGIDVNSCYAVHKATKVAFRLINTTNSNIWTRHPLLVTEMYEAELEAWHHHTKMGQECKGTKITLQPISPPEIMQEL